MTEPGDYEVGYRKPPKTTRFLKGAPSPNPKGRPKKEVSLIRQIEECMAENVNVTAADGTRTKMPAAKVIVKTIIRQAVSGSVPTQRMLLDIERRKTRPDAGPSPQEIEDEAAAQEEATEFARSVFNQLRQRSAAESSCMFQKGPNGEVESSDIGRPLMELYEDLANGRLKDPAEFKARLSTATAKTESAMCEAAFEHLARRNHGFKKSDLY